MFCGMHLPSVHRYRRHHRHLALRRQCGSRRLRRLRSSQALGGASFRTARCLPLATGAAAAVAGWVGRRNVMDAKGLARCDICGSPYALGIGLLLALLADPGIRPTRPVRAVTAVARRATTELDESGPWSFVKLVNGDSEVHGRKRHRIQRSISSSSQHGQASSLKPCVARLLNSRVAAAALSKSC